MPPALRRRSEVAKSSPEDASELLKLQSESAQINSKLTKFFPTLQNDNLLLRDVYSIVDKMKEKQEEQEKEINNLKRKLENSQESANRKMRKLEEELQKSGETQQFQKEVVKNLKRKLEESQLSAKCRDLKIDSLKGQVKVSMNHEVKILHAKFEKSEKNREISNQTLREDSGSVKHEMGNFKRTLLPETNFQIFFKMDKTRILGVESNYTIRTLKKILEEKTGIPARMMWMVYSGKPLLDEYSVNYYNIQKDSTIYVHFRADRGEKSEMNN